MKVRNFLNWWDQALLNKYESKKFSKLMRSIAKYLIINFGL